MGGHGVAAAVLALWLTVPAAAQEAHPQDPVKGKPQGPQKTHINAAHALSWEEDGVTVTFLTGGVTLDRSDLKLQAGRAMLWKSKDSLDTYDEIYAEGNVIFTRGVQKLNAERFYYNNPLGQGAVVDVRLKAYSKELKTDFFAMAREARINANDKEKMVADDVQLTSCSYGVPHYHLKVEHAILLGAEHEKVEKKGKLGFAPFGEDWTVDFDQLVPEFSGIPFLYIPGLALGPWLMNFPIRTIRAGHSSRFGNFVYTDFGSHIRITDDKGKVKQWGDIDLKVDYRQVRGEAGGIDLNYKWEGYKGYLDSYYLHDNGRRPGSEFDSQFPPLDHADRGKAHWFHRQDLDEHWRYELEAYYLSDRSLLQEFFPHEFQQEKEPESAAYVRWLNGNEGAFFLARYRLNDFQTQDQYLPRTDFNLLAQPILGGLFDNLYLTERLDVVDIRHKYDKDLLLSSVDTWRADAVSQLLMPFEFQYFQVAPLIQNRLTWYQEDLLGDPRMRDIWTAGTRLTAQVHATHPEIAWERAGIRGLRHVLELEARYTNNFYSNVELGDLFPFEPVDQLGRFEEVAFEIRQRFLTKDAANKPFEFMTLTLGIEYYPDSLRDTTAPAASNLEAPFDWIPLTSRPSDGAFVRRSWSNLHYEFALRPRNLFTLTAAGEYNPLTHAEEVREVGLNVTPIEGFTLSAGHERVRGVTDAVSLGTTWALTPKWSVSVFGQYDFRAGDYLKQDLVVARNFHDFSVEAVFERDFTRGENRFMVAFVPKFLGNAGLRRSHLYRPGEPLEAPTDR